MSFFNRFHIVFKKLNTEAPIRFLAEKIERFFKLHKNDARIARLSNKIVITAMAFLLLSSLVPFYDNAAGAYLSEDEAGVMDDMAFYSAQPVAEDGFLFKPALTSSATDRSYFGDVFVYKVESGDTLSSIASRFRVKKETIMWENDLYNEHRLRAGAQIRILPVDGVSHKVAKGDTLDKIAKKYKIEKAAILKQNQLTEDNPLIAEATLIIPGAKKEIPRYIASRGYISAPDSGAAYQYAGPLSANLIWPAQGKLTQGFKRGHYALDIANRGSGPIFAATSGTVVKASTGWNGGYGNMIIIDHGNGLQTLYGHMKKLYVEVGQTVSQGDTIGWMGNSGRVYGATGIHVHFEVRVNGVKYNPMNYF